jgi:hypothetical protein
MIWTVRTAEIDAHSALKTCHNEILSGSALPLDLLDVRINRWIEAQLIDQNSPHPAAKLITVWPASRYGIRVTTRIHPNQTQ